MCYSYALTLCGIVYVYRGKKGNTSILPERSILNDLHEQVRHRGTSSLQDIMRQTEQSAGKTNKTEYTALSVLSYLNLITCIVLVR